MASANPAAITQPTTYLRVGFGVVNCAGRLVVDVAGERYVGSVGGGTTTVLVLVALSKSTSISIGTCVLSPGALSLHAAKLNDATPVSSNAATRNLTLNFLSRVERDCTSVMCDAT